MRKNDEVHELVSVGEFARRMGVHYSSIRYAIAKGQIQTTGETLGQSKLIDWDVQSKNYKSNGSQRKTEGRKTETRTEVGKANAPSVIRRKVSEIKGTSELKLPRKNYNRLERHIGDSTVYEEGQMGIDPSNSRFDDIPDIDGIQAPEGSVAYYQAKKLAVDALRNLNKLKQETAQLVTVPDASTLYCDALAQVSDTIQTIPSRLSSAIVAEIRKDVDTWRIPPENLEAQIFRFLTLQVKEIMENIAHRIENADKDTREFVEAKLGK